MNLPIPSQQQQPGKTYNVIIEERKHDQNGNPIPQQQSPNTQYPFNQNKPNGTFNSYQPVEGERGSLQWEIKKMGANAFFPTTYTYGDFTFDANVAYQHNKNRKKCPALPSPDANSHPLFKMIHSVLEAVLTEEELKKVTYEKKDGRTKIYLPQSAHKEEVKDLNVKTYYGDYSDYINKVIGDTQNAPTPCKPKSKKDLIWFAINRIKSDYKSAYYYYNKEGRIDPDLAEYAKFKRNTLDGGNLLENIVYSDDVNYVSLDRFFGGKVDISKLLCYCKSYGKDNKQQQCEFVTGHQVILEREKGFNQIHTNVGSQAKEIRDDTSSVYNDTDSLLPLYENGIITEGTLTRLKTSLFGDSTEPIDVPDEMLMVYENAAQLAALDNKAFPSPDETTNRIYLTHAYQYTLFKLNGKKLQEYVTLREKKKTILPEREFNPYLHIGYNSGIPPEKQVRHMVLDEAAVGGKVITREEMANRLYIFAFTEQPLESGLMVQPYDEDLMTAYVSLVNETVPLGPGPEDWYISEDRRRKIASMALKKKYEGHTTLESFQKLGQAFKNLSYGNNLDNDSLEIKIQAQIVAPYNAYILPTLSTNQKTLRFSRSGKIPIIKTVPPGNLLVSIPKPNQGTNYTKAHLLWGAQNKARYMNVTANTNTTIQNSYIIAQFPDGTPSGRLTVPNTDNINVPVKTNCLIQPSKHYPYSPKAHGITIQESIINAAQDGKQHARLTMNDNSIISEIKQNADKHLQKLKIFVAKSGDNLYTIRLPGAQTAIQCSAEIAWDKKRYLPIRIKDSNGNVEELGRVDITSIGNGEEYIGNFVISNDKVTNFVGVVEQFPYIPSYKYSRKEINYENGLDLTNTNDIFLKNFKY